MPWLEIDSKAEKFSDCNQLDAITMGELLKGVNLPSNRTSRKGPRNLGAAVN
jgi:hypothetical protein